MTEYRLVKKTLANNDWYYIIELRHPGCVEWDRAYYNKHLVTQEEAIEMLETIRGQVVVKEEVLDV